MQWLKNILKKIFTKKYKNVKFDVINTGQMLVIK